MAYTTHLLSLFVLIQLYLVAASISNAHGNTTAASFCHPDHAAALVQLKQSFVFDYSTTTLPSWEPRTDCCLWEGVGCEDDGHVTVLDLGGCGLYSYGFHAALFNLTSLHYLDLGMNDFGGSRIPIVGFERLSKLTHLNLSYSGLYGQIPIAIGKLTSLVTLDLSSEQAINIGHSYASMSQFTGLGGRNHMLLREPSFQTLVANLTNLRELYLDGVDISGSGEEWCSVLGKSFPHLEVLSMSSCQLNGRIDSSMSRLLSLTVINLRDNYHISSVVPEFFADYLNLSLLQLSYNNFSGLFLQEIFQLRDIRVIDVSDNYELSGHLPEFPNGTALETLNLQYTRFSGINLSSFSNLLSLTKLGIDGGSISLEPTDMLFNQLNSLQNLQLSFVLYSGELGPFLSWISNLKNLRSLRFDSYWSAKILPPSIGNLTNLISLEIANCVFSGQIPPSIGNLSQLNSLVIFNCAFSGTLPSSIGNLMELRSLVVSSGSLSDTITTDIEHLSKLRVLTLTECKFSGRIPNTIVNLTQLSYVDLSYNNLTGEIPTSLFTSPAMLRLDLSSNQLSGRIQEFGLTSLVYVDLSSNKLSGTITLFAGLPGLMHLDLRSNNLTGLLQLSSLWKLRKLTLLDLSDNKLSVLDKDGEKPTVPLLPKLLGLELASCNMKTLPRFLRHVNHIQILDLSNNKLHGIIPKWIWEIFDDSLTSFNFSHNMFTHMELTTYVLPNKCMEYLDLSFNRLEGMIPMLPMPNQLTATSSFIQFLDYSNNIFSSVMSNFTAYLGQTGYLKLSKNNINGHIPYSICNSKNLEVLDLSYNNFSGVIPSCLIEDSSLLILSLRSNNFEGSLPYNVSKNCILQAIDLHGNKIQGQLPRSLSNCAALEVLDIGNNDMDGTFPSWLGRLPDLSVLVLRSNQFYGSLSLPPRDSKFRKSFSKLQILDIASNNFSGNLDPRWFMRFSYMVEKFNETGKILDHETWYSSYYHVVAITNKCQYVTIEKILTTLTSIDLSNNALEGDIPESTGRLVSLRTLNMSHNAFTGGIPPKIGDMLELESLDLSWNKLCGAIPEELTDLTFLSILNLCENNLEGRIPRLHQFATFENTSYEGNAGLCGPPLSKPCGNPSNPNEAQVNTSRDHIDIILFLFVGVGFGVGFTAAFLIKWAKLLSGFRLCYMILRHKTYS